MKDGAIERFVFASTGGAIYGEVPEGTSATEETAPAPISPYAIHKLAFEQLLGVYERERGLASRVLRYANVYGPRQDPHGEAGVVAIFSDAILAGRPLRINARAAQGDDGCVRDYVYVGDVATANALALKGKIEERALNVGTGQATTTRELAEGLMSVSGRQVPTSAGDHRAGDLARSVLDRRRLARYLPEPYALVQGLKETYEFMARRESKGSGS
jgi:UDP-glucose 4-epimerase